MRGNENYEHSNALVTFKKVNFPNKTEMFHRSGKHVETIAHPIKPYLLNPITHKSKERR